MSRLNDAIRARDEFLENHPWLLEEQKSIDRILEGKTPVQRYETMVRLLTFSLCELKAECQLLQLDIRRLDETFSKS